MPRVIKRRLNAGRIGGADSSLKTVALSVVMMALLLIVAGSCDAEEATGTFNIPSQPLANALVIFAEQSGLAVMAPADLLRDKTAPAVQGKMQPLTALDRLLKDSGLKYLHSAEGALTIAPIDSNKAIERKGAKPRAEVLPDFLFARGLGAGNQLLKISDNYLGEAF